MQIDVKDIADWLIDGARSSRDATDKMSELCERLIAAGIPLWRVGFFVRTLHPDIYGRNFIWRQGAGVTLGSVDFDIRVAPEFVASPLAIVFLQGLEIRCRIDDPESKRFPILDDLRGEGVTDYIALPFQFVDGSVHASSWTTRQEGGFTDDQLSALRSILLPLTRVVEIIAFRRVAVDFCLTPMSAHARARVSSVGRSGAVTPSP